MQALATQYGIGLRVFDAQRDVYILVTQMQFARAAGARALIVCSLNANLIDAAIREAAEAGLPIVAFSSVPIPGAVTVINDNEQTGRVLGEAAARYALTYYPNPADLTAIVMNDGGSDIMAMRARGLIEGLLDGAELAALSIIDADVTTNQLGADEYVHRLLNDHTPFHFVLTPNDAATLGVITALEAAGIPSRTHDEDTVNVFAVSTGTNAAVWLEQGRYVRGYVEINRRLTVETAFNATVKLMGGGSLPETLLIPAEHLIIETQFP